MPNTREEINQLVQRVVRRCREAQHISFSLALIMERRPNQIAAIQVLADLLNDHLANTMSMTSCVADWYNNDNGEPGPV